MILIYYGKLIVHLSEFDYITIGRYNYLEFSLSKSEINRIFFPLKK